MIIGVARRRADNKWINLIGCEKVEIYIQTKLLLLRSKN